MKKQKNLAELAAEWVFALSKSAAKTEEGKRRAIEKYAKKYIENSIEDYYLDAMRIEAFIQMKDDFDRRATIITERKKIKQYPVWSRGLIASTDVVRKTYSSRAGKYATGWSDEICKKIAFTDIFSQHPRLRKIFYGKNMILPGLRSENNGKWGWDKVSWHYADYTAIIDQSGHKIAYRADEGNKFEIFYVFNNKLHARGKIYSAPPAAFESYTIKPHHLRRYYSLSIPASSPVRWEWDIDEKKGYYIYRDEKYHTTANTDRYKSSRTYFQEAIQAFQKRKREQIEKAKESRIFAHLDRIFVDINDSIAAGNCKTITHEWAEKMKCVVGAEGDCAIRADLIWAERNDSYARRAILHAAGHSKI